MTDKTHSQTYNFLSENKSIEEIKEQPNIDIKGKRRHGGLTYKLIEVNNTNNQSVNDNLSENNKSTIFDIGSFLLKLFF